MNVGRGNVVKVIGTWALWVAVLTAHLRSRLSAGWKATTLTLQVFLGNRVGMQFVEMGLILAIVVLVAAVAAFTLQAPIKAMFAKTVACLTAPTSKACT